jgi:hypothetical protein
MRFVQKRFDDVGLDDICAQLQYLADTVAKTAKRDDLIDLDNAALRYFLEVARSGSLSKASERLYVAVSALIWQIAKVVVTLTPCLYSRSIPTRESPGRHRPYFPAFSLASSTLTFQDAYVRLRCNVITHHMSQMSGVSRGDSIGSPSYSAHGSSDP